MLFYVLYQITKAIDISVKMTVMNVSRIFSNLRDKNIYIILTNQRQFSEISRKEILDLRTPLKKSLILIAAFLNKSTKIITPIITSSNTQISHNKGPSR